MTFACTFDAIPRTITSGGSVRFFPTVSGTTNEIVAVGATPAYYWEFGDGATSDWATPIYEYPATSTPETWDVTLTVCDASGATCTFTITDFITSESADNINSYYTGGSFLKIAIILRNPLESGSIPDLTILTRTGNLENPMRLLNVVSIDDMDRIGTLKFTVLDTGDATQAQINYLQAGVCVTLVMGTEVMFDGIIRRVAKNAQCGYNSTNRVNMWDIECDSSIAKLKLADVDITALSVEGVMLKETPGYLLRRVLTPNSSAVWSPSYGDNRGVICNVDCKQSFQLNSSTKAESVGSRYDQVTKLQEITNYDLRVRPVYKVYRYVSLNEASP